LSFRRRPESRQNKDFWTPAFAGVTARETFYEVVKLEIVTEQDLEKMEGRRGSRLWGCEAPAKEEEREG